MPDEHATSIPPELTRCPVCDEYRGSAPARRLNWNEPLEAFKRDDVFEVKSVCEGISCRCCGKMLRRPIFNYYDEETNTVWHVPYFVGMVTLCRECRSKHGTE